MKTSHCYTYFFILIAQFSLFARHIPITLWVHGTNVQTLFPIQPQKYLRWHSAPSGIHPVDSISQEYNVHALLSTLAQADPSQFPFEHMYAFGWSGILDNQERHESALQLAAALNELHKQYTHHGDTISVTLICHSHGGNVALLATQYLSLTVDRLILLACPVQQETAHLTKSSCLKRIYSFYSTGDLVQVGDPQALHPWRTAITQALINKSFDPLKAAWHLSCTTPFFSQRSFDLQHNLANVQVRWDDSFPWTPQDIQVQPEMVGSVLRYTANFLHKPHPVLHTEFILPSFVTHIPELLSRVDTQWVDATSTITPLSI